MNKEEAKATAHIINPVAWILENELVNENQKPFEFTKHRFMIKPYMDTSPDLVVMKSAQIGYSVAAILKSVHACNFLKLNVIYVLPTRNASAEFVVPKVNPMLKRNPSLAALVKETDNKSLKQVGNRFLYFKGAFHQGEAISTSADLIVADEYDRSDQAVLSTYNSRLQASDYGWYWRFSNPSLPSFGVHELWQESDQNVWVVECPKCEHEMYMNFDRDDVLKCHYVDQDRRIYACGDCGAEITNAARQNGRWWVTYPKRKRRGYWISQMMIPWVSADDILELRKRYTTEDFHNFVLGLPYQSSEFMLTADAIKRACRPGLADKTDVVIGCDSGKTKHYVIGNRQGIFNYGTTDSWDDIERLITMYNATAVIDALPDFTVPEALSRKYHGRVFVNYYVHDSKSMDVSTRNNGVNYGRLDTDRTKIFDLVASELTSDKIRFYQEFDDLKGKDGMGLVYHLNNIYRITEEDTRGILRARWEKKENKPDHWAHALVYWRVGVSMTLGAGETGGVTVKPTSTVKKSYAVRKDGTVPVKEVMGDMDKLLDKSIASNNKKRRIRDV